MERLTKRDEYGNAKYNHDADGHGLVWDSMLLDRLVSYEDTNLTPSDIADLRNELCLKCGKYKMAHKGACDGCRWKKGE